MMCQNYEKQLQRLQKEYMSVSEKDEQLGDKVKDLEVVFNFFCVYMLLQGKSCFFSLK